VLARLASTLLCPEKYYVYVPSYNSNTHNDYPPFPLSTLSHLSLMAKTHSRSPSPEPKTGASKRVKIGHQSYTASTAVPNPAPGPATPQDVVSCFAPDLFDADNVGRLAASYSTSEPFKHALIEKLFRDDLLQRVKDECLSELHFTEKETDIYKVNEPSTYLLIPSPSLLPN